MTESSFAVLANLTFVKMSLENGEVLVNVSQFVPIVYVVEVFKAEEVLLETVVDAAAEGLVHILSVANTVVHKMELSLQDQEVI